MTATGKSDGPEVSLPGWTIQRAKRVMKKNSAQLHNWNTG
jgi:hypothetical protein